MSLAAGMGSVTTKNVFVYGPLSEKLNATAHCNGNDVWVMTRQYNDNVYRAYLVSNTGLSSSAVTSSVGAIHGLGYHQGQLKFSPGGNKIAAVCSGTAEVLDFNRTSGIVSNPLLLSTSGQGGFWGCEFSGDGTKLYSTYATSITLLVQWDLCAGNAAAIIASEYVQPTVHNYLGSMQLSSNGKIYATHPLDQSLAVINTPNLKGAACSYSPYAQGVSSGTLSIGLPNFKSGFYVQNLSSYTYSATLNRCQTYSFQAGDDFTCQKTIDPTLLCISNFGDPSSGTANSSVQQNPVHRFSNGGTYTVTISYQAACSTRTFSQVINVREEPAIQVSQVSGQSLIICKQTTVSLTASGAHTYTWMPFSTNSGTISVYGGLQSAITLTGQDTITGCTSDKVFSVLESNCSGWIANDIPMQLIIYPNPAENHLVLESMCEGHLSLIDLCGKILIHKKILEGKNTIDLYGLDAGFYSGLFQSELGNQRFCFSRISPL